MVKLSAGKNPRMEIAILGWGREGKSLAKYLRKRWKSSVLLTVLDKRQKLDPGERQKNLRYRLGKNYLKNLSDFDRVYRTPGVPFLLPELQRAITKGTEVSSATRLFFEEVTAIAKRHKSGLPKIIGITGTKGKGTTATILKEILAHAGFSVILAGNIGTPMLDVLDKVGKADYVILELSSFQLQDLPYSPEFSIVLDITPDHLDVHKTFEEYWQAKAAISKHQSASGMTFYFEGSEYGEKVAALSPGQKIAVSEDGFPLVSQEEFPVPGKHTYRNALMAAAVAKWLGASSEEIREAITSFKGLPHRMELVREISATPPRSIYFYNDSAGTNPEAAIAAIQSFHQPAILIAGGKDKKLDYRGLKKAIRASSIRAVILFGENRNKLRKAFSGLKPPLLMSPTLAMAVQKAYSLAQAVAAKKDSVHIIFSPASASFDMFKDYQDRGAQFIAAVKKL